MCLLVFYGRIWWTLYHYVHVYNIYTTYNKKSIALFEVKYPAIVNSFNEKLWWNACIKILLNNIIYNRIISCNKSYYNWWFLLKLETLVKNLPSKACFSLFLLFRKNKSTNFLITSNACIYKVKDFNIFTQM